MEQRQAKQKSYHDRRHNCQLMVEEGEKVLVRVFRERLHRWDPGHVEEVLGDRMLRVKLQSGAVVTRHLDQVQLESFSPSADIDTNIDSDEDIVSNDADQIIPPVEQAEGRARRTSWKCHSSSYTFTPSTPEPLPPASSVVPAAQQATTTENRYPTRLRRPPD